MRFDGFLGNPDLKERISKSFENGKLSHAILIEGPGGIGKSTLARLISAALLCENVDEKPCFRCRSCKNALNGVHSDLTIISGAGSTNSISIDSIRAVHSDTYVRPNEADKKIYIIKDAQNMTLPAQNSLLKILEEPPVGVCFILLAESKNDLLPTILSRTQCFTLSGLDMDTSIKAVKERLINTDEETIALACRISGGIVGKAVSLIELNLLSKTEKFINDFFDKLSGSSELQFLRLMPFLENEKDHFEQICEILILYLNDILMWSKTKNDRFLSFQSKKIYDLSKIYKAEDVLALIEIFRNSLGSVQYNANYKLNTADTFVKCWEEVH